MFMSRSGRNTEPISISIDKVVLKKLDEYCKKKLIPRSKLIGKIIKDFLEGKK